MRVRNVLTLAFLVAALVPSALYCWISYQRGVEQEFVEVEDRHLLLAQNLGDAMERYHVDLVATFETVSDAMYGKQELPRLERLMDILNLNCVIMIDEIDGTVVSRVDLHTFKSREQYTANELEMFSKISNDRVTKLSGVMAAKDDGNQIIAVRKLGQYLFVGRISTEYFIELGKSISFGEKGHAAIVDQFGSVLAHPLDSWIEQRKNISKVSAVSRMMNGQTGIQRFYSPALKGDMIAGFTTVAGAGWGVMIPQPISEIYDKVGEAHKALFTALIVGLILTSGLVAIFLRLFSAPLERLARLVQDNANVLQLNELGVISGVVSLSEVKQLTDAYNDMVRKISRANRKIEHLAYADHVTGLSNRSKFHSLVERELVNTDQTLQKQGSLIFIDLDNFKEINDLNGHDVGDKVLCHYAIKLEAFFKNFDTKRSEGFSLPDHRACVVARIGGDEFAAMLPGICDENELLELLAELEIELQLRSAEEGTFQTNCSASIGCARYPLDAKTADELIKRADIAMYFAKKSGKNRYQLFNSSIGTQTAAEIRRDVQRAIEVGDLVLEFQPKISATTQSTVGVEALVRWNNPQLGRLTPELWMPAITDSPVIAELGEWVIEKALGKLSAWSVSYPGLSLSVNIASNHFVSPRFVNYLEDRAKHHRIDRSKVEVEITEDTLFERDRRAEEVVQQLRELGFRIAIDDFGKGYSNIARFAQLQVDVIKIDKSILANLYDQRRSLVVMKSMVAMASELSCEIVAEGVETLEQVEVAKEIGVDVLQGYYFAKSLSPEDFLVWMEYEANNTTAIEAERVHACAG